MIHSYMVLGLEDKIFFGITKLFLFAKEKEVGNVLLSISDAI